MSMSRRYAAGAGDASVPGRRRRPGRLSLWDEAGRAADVLRGDAAATRPRRGRRVTRGMRGGDKVVHPIRRREPRIRCTTLS